MENVLIKVAPAPKSNEEADEVKTLIEKNIQLGKKEKLLNAILTNLPNLNEIEHNVFRVRFMDILTNLRHRVFLYSIIFHYGRFIVTVGSLFVPALLSIQSQENALSINVYWFTWIVSLLVTMSNGVLTLFKVEKKYYYLHTVLEQLLSEAWQYVGLTGRYSGDLCKPEKPTHKNQFVFFTHAVERIKMKQVEEEYYKPLDHGSHSTGKKEKDGGKDGKDSGEKPGDSMNVKTPHNSQMEETIKHIKTKDPKLFRDIREESGIDETYFEKKE
jgi:hypothetical protein